jgi:Mg/Co/Ni transporter MgtE
VIDDDGTLIGIVTVDDVLDAAQDMATRDLRRVGGSAVLGEPYLTVSTARALGEVTLRDWWRVARRELISGLALGGMLGIIGFSLALLPGRSLRTCTARTGS